MNDFRIRLIRVLQLVATLHCLLCAAFGQEKSTAKKQRPQIEATRGVQVKDATYSSIRDVYSFDLSSIGGTKLKVTQREETRNITSVMTAQSNEGTIVVIVATKIRPDFPQDDSLLGKEKHRFEIGAQLYGADYELSDREEDGHRILEYTFLHEEYDPANFPFASGQKENAKGKETLGIHRIFVSSGQFFEVAMILTNSGAGVKELKEKAKAAVKQVVAGIKVNPVKK